MTPSIRQFSRCIVLPAFSASVVAISQFLGKSLEPDIGGRANRKKADAVAAPSSAPIGDATDATATSIPPGENGFSCRRASRRVNQSVSIVTGPS